MKNLNAGDLRHCVTLQRDTAVGQTGQHIPSYGTIGKYFALVEQVSGDENMNAQQMKGVRHYRVTMRAGVGQLKPSDQLLWNGSILNVKSSVIDPFNIFMVVECTELIASQ